MNFETLIPSKLATSSFFHCNEQMQQVVANTRKAAFAQEHLLYNRWEVTKIILQAPFHLLELFLLHVVAQIPLTPHSLQRRLIVAGIHKNARFSQWLLQLRYGTDYLAPSRNVHDRSTAWFYTQPDLPFSLCYQNKLLNRMKSNNAKRDKFKFFHPDGLCNGAVHWLLYLFHLTRAHCKDLPVAHMRALVDLSRKGWSVQAAFLQNFLGSPFLNIERVHTFTLPSDGEEQSNQLSAFEVGTYGITISGDSFAHRLAYIKIDKELGFLFDPYFGCMRLQGQQQGRKVLEFFEDYPWWKVLNIQKVRFDRIMLKKSMQKG
jgi:hypothetical protein